MIKIAKESLVDIYIAFKVYLDYKRAYISVFIVFMSGIVALVFSGILFMKTVVLDNIFQLNEDLRLLIILPVLAFLFSVYFFLIAYTNTIFGLTYDIMTSGELFTEFRRSITYFKKLWPFFMIFMLPIALIILAEQFFGLFLIIQFIATNEDNRLFLLLVKIPAYSLEFLIYVLLIEIFPGITATKQLNQSMSENREILRKNFRRVLLSVGFYFLLFRIPMFVVDIARILLVSSEETLLLCNIAFLIVTLLNAVVGMPILSLVSTRIYNTTIMDQNAELILQGQ
ncbi:MAG: hypothetical protein ACFFD4_12950 [Candidatus Odinarchaeota archaeon]